MTRTRNRWIRTTVAVALVAATACSSKQEPSEPQPTPTPATADADADAVQLAKLVNPSELREAFNQESERVRVILLLEPG